MNTKFLPKKNQGLAIIVALFFAFCMLILFVTMVFRQSTTARQNLLTIRREQAFFAAQAAIQHFLLKSRYFPTELYDAVEFVQGKNPLANFSEFPSTTDDGRQAFETYGPRNDLFVRILPEPELDMQGNPRYFYHPLSGKDAFIRLGSYRNPDYRFLIEGIVDTSAGNKYTTPRPLDSSLNGNKYLQYFIRDCTNMTINGTRLQPALEMVIAPGISSINNWDLAVEEGYPYTLDYMVSRVEIQSIEGLRRYGEEAIQISVEGITRDFQGHVTDQTQVRVERITRRGAL